MYDVIIIGAGPGGYVAAIRAAQLGMNTALIDKGETLGGTCLNVGCIPSKALLESSHRYAFLKNHSHEHGIFVDKLSVNFSDMMARKNRIVKGLVDSVAGLIKRNKIDWISATASFKEAHRISIAGKETIEIEGKQIIIATGSEPISLSFLPFDEQKVLSSTGALHLSEIPPRLAVIGAGVIGVEIASVYSRLGAEVVLIEMLDHICLGIDHTIGKMFLKNLQKQGMKFHLSSKVTEAKIGTAIQLTIESSSKTEKLEVDAVLVSVGRKPYTQRLGLDKAGVKTEKNGLIPVDSYFRTNIPHIFAIGDVIAGPQLAHRASEEGIAVIEYLAGQKPHVNYLAIPSVIYTLPELASVGFTEQEAKERGFAALIGNYAFRGNARARCMGEEEGSVKIIGDQKSGRLLGMHILSVHASEMIGEGVIALEKEMTVAELASASHAHPTLCEAIKEAALNALGRAIHL